ncbi:hypothetical protein HYS03_00495 [Candidatus Woesebacteria bacterium]|nr:hypothetical protein [Candidatus Woesebacteria bacterium]QQG47631.1 MAG: hypothetical protein HY044_00915 [Candidatus Woesebacteria bacterium]
MKKFSLKILNFKLFVWIVTVFVLVSLFLGRIEKVMADTNCDNPGPETDLNFCISQIKDAIDKLAPAQEANKKELSSLNQQLTDLKNRISGISVNLDDLEKQIQQREIDLSYTKQVFDEKTFNHYKFLRTYDPLISFLESNSASEAFQEIFIRAKIADQDRATMDAYSQDLTKLKGDKTNLEKNKASLSAARAQVDSRATFLAGEVSKVDSYLSELSSKQQELEALKAGGFATSVGDTPDTLEPCSGASGTSNFCDPGYRPAFAAFSFGAPHRTGMSQYGAYGRAKSGQSFQTILSAYYQGAQLTSGYSEPGSITVSGYGAISFEDNYLLGIYEIPESWGDNGGFEALKAQAIAARSYALYATNNGASSICPDESCQVYKSQLKSGKWRDAVSSTRGMVLLKDGKPAAAYYASTSGGYTISQWGWSGIKDASGDWPSTAYERLAGSPWFYKGWYKSRGGASCGRGNPWLTSSEMADIVNAWTVLYKQTGDASRVSPIDTSCWGGNPYSLSDLAGIGGYSSVSGVSVIYSNSGNTLNVTFSTNKGSVTIDGGELARAFNLRAPGYVGIKSSLFNIEKL